MTSNFREGLEKKLSQALGSLGPPLQWTDEGKCRFEQNRTKSSKTLKLVKVYIIFLVIR